MRPVDPTPEPARLDELDADEMFDVARVFKPDLTREAFDVQWAEFARLKRQRALS